MTKLLSISVFALALVFSASTMAGCEKKDDKKKNDTTAKKDDAKKEGETKPDDKKKDTANADGDKADPNKDGAKKPDDPTTKTATAEVTTPPATGDAGDLIKKAADEVCACKDADCAKKVGTRMQKWAMAKMATLKTPAEQKAFFAQLQGKYKADMDRGKKCADKLKGTSTTTTKAPPTGGPVGPAVAMFKKFTDEMCACKDVACSGTVQKKMMAWGKAQKVKPNANDMKALMGIQKRFASCFMRLRKGAMKPTPKK